MNKALKLMVSAIALVLMAAPLASSFAQYDEMFRDVPLDHWAYDSVKELKPYLVGYPDGDYKGERMMTRYEFAAATRRIYEELSRRLEMVQTKRSIDFEAGTKSDIAGIKAKLAELEGLESDVAKLQKLAAEFQNELAKLGVDVKQLMSRMDAAESDIDQLKKDVEELKARPKPVITKGDLMVAVIAATEAGGRGFYDLNGDLKGVRFLDEYDQELVPAGMTRDNQVVHELALGIDADLKNGVKAEANFILSNYLSYLDSGRLYGSQPMVYELGGAASRLADGSKRRAGDTEVGIWDAKVTFGLKAMGGINAVIGRQGYKATPLTFGRVDPDYYIDNPRYDDGLVYFDGLKLGFDWNTVKLDVFAGKNNNISATSTSNYQAIWAGRTYDGYATWMGNGENKPIGSSYFPEMLVETTLGAHMNINLFKNSNLGLTYILMDGNADQSGPRTMSIDYDRVIVMGANLDFAIADDWKVKGEYAVSQMFYGTNEVLNDDNDALTAGLWYSKNRVSFDGGYKEIGPYYSAPGNWGRISNWYNPFDIKGWNVNLGYAFCDRLTLTAGGEFYEGTGKISYGLQEGDKLNRYQVKAAYKINDLWSMNLDWEGVVWDMESLEAKPIENYYTLGFGYKLSGDAALKLLYQVVDFDPDGVSAFELPLGDGKGRGSVLVTQVSVKF